MLNPPPPLFEAAPAPAPAAKIAEPALVLCGAQTDAATDWWALANAIANELLDATTLDQVNAIATRRAPDLAALTNNARDLALTLSAGFQDRRRQLGWA